MGVEPMIEMRCPAVLSIQPQGLLQAIKSLYIISIQYSLYMSYSIFNPPRFEPQPEPKYV